MSETLLPGRTIGILGGGQLGRMLALAARPMGYRTVVFEPELGCPASQVADVHIAAAYSDGEALARFTEEVDVATVEFENIPVEALKAVAAKVPLRPDWNVVEICQNRLREKTWLRDNGIPCPRFTEADSPRELAEACEAIGFPCVIKTAAFGYDGKGQVRVDGRVDDWNVLWEKVDAPHVIIEEWITFECEFSVIGARNVAGKSALFEPGRNVHANHILDTTTVPAGIPLRLIREARSLINGVLSTFDYVGVVGVELFMTTQGQILVNEIAPRTHNSGHHTIDACLTSQFEQQVRAICGLPLGDPALKMPVEMKNLLGDLWIDSPTGEPDWKTLLNSRGRTKLHLYGKTTPKRLRKMGHLTTLG